MASITKHPKSQYWTACYTSRDGRQLKRSTKTTERNQAMEIAVELERVERQAKQGAVTTTQLRKVLSDVSEKINGDNLDVPSIKDYLDDWLKAVATRNSAKTLERYEIVSRLFIGHLKANHKLPVTAICPKHIDDFVTERLEAGMAPKTVVIDLKILNTAFRRAEGFGLVLKNPVAAVRPPKVESSERELFTHEEVEKLLEAAPDHEWQMIILLGYFVGARLSDCVHMKWENIRPDEGVIVYEQRKTGRKVIVPLTFHVLDHLTYLSRFGTTGFLAPKLANKTPGGKHGLSESFKRIVKRAGLDPMVVDGKGVRKFTKRTFHSLRHSFNSLLANAGVAEEIRMKLTGHTTRAVHARYTHHELQTLKNAMTAVSVFGGADNSPKISTLADHPPGADARR